jgi:hypothetical protein
VADAPPGPGRRRGRRLAVGLAVAALVLLAAVGTYLVLLSRVSTESVTVEEARERAGTTGGEGDQGTAADVLRPAAGVYRYRGEGTERLDKPPTSQTQGPEIPGTLTHLEGGCWRLRVDYNTNHWQSWDYCQTDGGLVEVAGEFFQRLDLVVATVDTTSGYTCDPPVDAIRDTQQAGDEWPHECRGSSSGTEGEVVSSGPYTFVGPEVLEIGGTEVEALHYVRSRTLTGGQDGTEEVEIWFDAATGLPLRNERDITVRSGSVVGSVTYEEEGSFELESLTPAT